LPSRESHADQNSTNASIPRHTRDALFVDENTLRVNCGRCGKELLVRLEDLRDKRVIDCDECVSANASPKDESSKQKSHPNRRC
jgi:predicted RNA-binding Zn-ribbon protein involved in translation (DUF1610 family)